MSYDNFNRANLIIEFVLVPTELERFGVMSPLPNSSLAQGTKSKL